MFNYLKHKTHTQKKPHCFIYNNDDDDYNYVDDDDDKLKKNILSSQYVSLHVCMYVSVFSANSS